MDLGKLTALQLAEKIKQHQISVLDGVKYVFCLLYTSDAADEL